MVQGALEHLMKNRTTIIIAHRLSTIQNVDKIVTLKDGTIQEIGSPKELANSGGIYTQLLALQQGHSSVDKKKLKEFGKVNKESIEKYVKFTVGNDCKSFDEALDRYNKIRASCVPDAFIVAFYKGKRMQLSELKEKGMLPKRN